MADITWLLQASLRQWRGRGQRAAPGQLPDKKWAGTHAPACVWSPAGAHTHGREPHMHTQRPSRH